GGRIVEETGGVTEGRLDRLVIGRGLGLELVEPGLVAGLPGGDRRTGDQGLPVLVHGAQRREGGDDLGLSVIGGAETLHGGGVLAGIVLVSDEGGRGTRQ